MEEVFFRFPHLAEDIFENLNCFSLLQCKLVARDWRGFITDQKFYYFQLIKTLTNCSDESLKKIFPKRNWEAAVELYSKIIDIFSECKKRKNVSSEKFYKKGNKISFFNTPLRTPLHEAAEKGELAICQLIIENVEDKKKVSLFS